jgi:hypothetical protein
MLKGRGLMSELVWLKRLTMLILQRKGILILEMMRPQGVSIKAMEMGCRWVLADMKAVFGSGQREWCS